jgi:hypothetical protein
MNVRQVEKFVEPRCRLQRQNSHVPNLFGNSSERLSFRPIHTEYKSNVGSISQALAYLYKQVHPLFFAKASRIKRNDCVVCNSELGSQRDWISQGVNHRSVHPVWK